MTAAVISISTQVFKNAFTAPFRLGEYFRAYERFRKFKQLDPYLMQDVGVTQAEIDNVKFEDFLN